MEVKFGDGLRQAKTSDYSTLSISKQQVRLPLNTTIAFCYCCSRIRETGPRFYVPFDFRLFRSFNYQNESLLANGPLTWLRACYLLSLPEPVAEAVAVLILTVQVLGSLSEANTGKTLQ